MCLTQCLALHWVCPPNNLLTGLRPRSRQWIVSGSVFTHAWIARYNHKTAGHFKQVKEGKMRTQPGLGPSCLESVPSVTPSAQLPLDEPPLPASTFSYPSPSPSCWLQSLQTPFLLSLPPPCTMHSRGSLLRTLTSLSLSAALCCPRQRWSRLTCFPCHHPLILQMPDSPVPGANSPWAQGPQTATNRGQEANSRLSRQEAGRGCYGGPGPGHTLCMRERLPCHMSIYIFLSPLLPYNFTEVVKAFNGSPY